VAAGFSTQMAELQKPARHLLLLQAYPLLVNSQVVPVGEVAVAFGSLHANVLVTAPIGGLRLLSGHGGSEVCPQIGWFHVPSVQSAGLHT
jgi:hypothetical protein